MRTLTPAQRDTLEAIARGQVTRSEDWVRVYGARADVLGRLEGRGLIDLGEAVTPERRRLSAVHRVTLTADGEAALR